MLSTQDCNIAVFWGTHAKPYHDLNVVAHLRCKLSLQTRPWICVVRLEFCQCHNHSGGHFGGDASFLWRGTSGKRENQSKGCPGLPWTSKTLHEPQGMTICYHAWGFMSSLSRLDRLYVVNANVIMMDTNSFWSWSSAGATPMMGLWMARGNTKVQCHLSCMIRYQCPLVSGHCLWLIGAIMSHSWSSHTTVAPFQA